MLTILVFRQFCFFSPKNCKIYLVGTKLDVISDISERAVGLDMVARYSKRIEAPFIETSSKTGENVGEFRSVLSYSGGDILISVLYLLFDERA